MEGGCYAKTIDLSPEGEPEIHQAIRFGALLENIGFEEDGVTPNYADDSITPNTRVSYPIHHIPGAVTPSVGGHPTDIFFLTCDAFGVLPPLSRLDKGQAMYHFLSGYTAKVAGTEAGVVEPQTTFSACFGAPFLPLHATEYARMLGERMTQHGVRMWLVNTGWTGGGYGVGHRMKLSYTRAMIAAALRGDLDAVETTIHPVFKLAVPVGCEGVPNELWDVKGTWAGWCSLRRGCPRIGVTLRRQFHPIRRGGHSRDEGRCACGNRGVASLNVCVTAGLPLRHAHVFPS